MFIIKTNSCHNNVKESAHIGQHQEPPKGLQSLVFGQDQLRFQQLEFEKDHGGVQELSDRFARQKSEFVGVRNDKKPILWSRYQKAINSIVNIQIVHEDQSGFEISVASTGYLEYRYYNGPKIR